ICPTIKPANEYLNQDKKTIRRTQRDALNGQITLSSAVFFTYAFPKNGKKLLTNDNFGDIMQLTEGNFYD
ncbi:MAG: hypothetical protein II241_07660, partial [Clostridia bacterium]|nr:hypothetical protein [Clostridia bacterium]